MKKFLLITLGVIATIVVVGYLFRAPLMAAVMDQMTSDMFIAEDTDTFDPGIAIGATLPSINAMYDGETITDLGAFIGDKGMIFIANRSSDW